MAASRLAAVATLAVALLLAACGEQPAGEGEQRIVDLVTALPAATVLAESELIDLGSEAAVPHLHRGWSWRERAGDGTSIVWGVGESSELVFFSGAPRPLVLTLRCWPYRAPDLPSQQIRVELNDEPIGLLELARGWQELELELPATAVRAGENRVAFHYRYHRVPPGSKVARSVAVAWDWIRFAGIAGGEGPRADRDRELLYLPQESQVDYYLELPPGARLRADHLRLLGSSAGRLRVSVTGEAAAEELLAEIGEASASMDLPLAGAGGLLRLRLRVTGPDESGGPGTGFALAAPRIVASAPVTLPPPAPPPAAPPSGPAARPPVVVYLVDTLRADRVGAYGARAGLTPNLDAFARQGVVFLRAAAQSAATLPSTASIFTGLWPREHGALREDRRIPERLDTLPELLGRAGYATAASVANGFVTAPFGFADGFDHFVFHRGEPSGAELRQSLFGWLDERPEAGPLFLYLHSIEPHDAYAPPDEFRRRFAPDAPPAAGSKQTVKELKAGKRQPTPELRRAMEALYDAEVAHADDEFGRFLDELRRRGLYDEALIVFLSDHGEEFFDHGSWMHGHTLYGELVNVPLVLRLPGGRGAGRRVEERVQQIDLVPTILELLGLPPPPGLRGRSLLGDAAAERPEPLVFSAAGEELVGVTRGRWKLTVRLPAYLHAGVELYDLVVDPGERENLRDRRPIVAGYLLSRIREELQRVAAIEPAPRREDDREVDENLRNLGYLN